MKIIERKRLLFLTGKDVYFADRPIDVDECDSVTFIGCKTSRKIAGFKSTPALTAITDLRPDIDCIWEKLDKKSNRQRIKRAEKQGITIHRNQYLKEFYQLNKQFTEKKGFDQFLDFGALSFAEMGKYGTLFTAKYQGEIVGGHLYLEDEKHIRLVISASKRLAVTKEQAAIIGRANRLLHWESIKYAKEKGIVEFDWGGCGLKKMLLKTL